MDPRSHYLSTGTSTEKEEDLALPPNYPLTAAFLFIKRMCVEKCPGIILGYCKWWQNFLLDDRQKLKRGYCVGKVISEEIWVSILTSYYSVVNSESNNIKGQTCDECFRVSCSQGYSLQLQAHQAESYSPCLLQQHGTNYSFPFCVLFPDLCLFVRYFLLRKKVCSWGCSGLTSAFMAFKSTCYLSRMRFPLVWFWFLNFSGLGIAWC